MHYGEFSVSYRSHMLREAWGGRPHFPFSQIDAVTMEPDATLTEQVTTPAELAATPATPVVEPAGPTAPVTPGLHLSAADQAVEQRLTIDYTVGVSSGRPRSG